MRPPYGLHASMESIVYGEQDSFSACAAKAAKTIGIQRPPSTRSIGMQVSQPAFLESRLGSPGGAMLWLTGHDRRECPDYIADYQGSRVAMTLSCKTTSSRRDSFIVGELYIRALPAVMPGLPRLRPCGAPQSCVLQGCAPQSRVPHSCFPQSCLRKEIFLIFFGME